MFLWLMNYSSAKAGVDRLDPCAEPLMGALHNVNYVAFDVVSIRLKTAEASVGTAVEFDCNGIGVRMQPVLVKSMLPGVPWACRDGRRGRWCGLCVLYTEDELPRRAGDRLCRWAAVRLQNHVPRY